MKFLKSGLMSLSIVLLLSACVATDKAKSEKHKKLKKNITKFLKKDKIEAKKFAISHADNYYKALKNKDYASLCKSKKISKKDFTKWHKAVTKTFGTLESKNYISSLSNPFVIRYMWKWNFSKKVEGKTLTREVLFNIFIVKDKKTNKYILFGAGMS